MLESILISSPSAVKVDQNLKTLSVRMEGAFLSEMLKHTEPNQGSFWESSGGGDDFSFFLREQRAMAMAQAGGIGLAQSLYDSLTKASA